jgi:hypothetical protein
MASPYDQLIQSIVETGLTEDEARIAARRCVLAMAKQGIAGYAGGGALAYFLAMSPGIAVGAMTLGAGHALAKSPQCSDVRQAIRFWNTAPL